MRTIFSRVSAPMPGLPLSASDTADLDTPAIHFKWDAAAGGVDGEYYLLYFGASRPAFRVLELPEGISFEIELIDAWEMTITRLDGLFTNGSRVDLPGKPYQALRIRRVG